MKENYLKKLLNSKKLLQEKINNYQELKLIKKIEPNNNEIKGHFTKAEHNLKFVSSVSNDFSDWIVVGCYYCLYHLALALINKKGLYSKNHDATLCLLIQEYYKDLSDEDFELINFTFINNEDILFYVSTKDKREKASYSTKLFFDNQDLSIIILKTRLLFNKLKQILEN